jgi:hypothetical protein
MSYPEVRRPAVHPYELDPRDHRQHGYSRVFRLFRERDVDRVGERINLVTRRGQQRHGRDQRLAFGFVQRHLPPEHLQLDLGRTQRCTGVTDLPVQTAHQDGRLDRHEIDETVA